MSTSGRSAGRQSSAQPSIATWWRGTRSASEHPSIIMRLRGSHHDLVCWFEDDLREKAFHGREQTEPAHSAKPALTTLRYGFCSETCFRTAFQRSCPLCMASGSDLRRLMAPGPLTTSSFMTWHFSPPAVRNQVGYALRPGASPNQPSRLLTTNSCTRLLTLS